MSPEGSTKKVPPILDGERLDRVVAVLAGVSRSQARTLVDAEGVLVDGEVGTASQRVRSGCELTIPSPSVESVLEPEDVPFEVRHEDEHIIVVDKPPGVVTHPGAGNRTGTLAGGLLHRFPEIEGVGQRDRWGLVHRLDRDTSGLLLVARTSESYLHLVDAMRQRRISRRYLALVAGRLELPTGMIEAPIARDPRQPTRMRVDAEGKDAVTHYEEVRTVDDDTMVEVALETGRTHQIRVHMAAIDHPVIGDRVYGSGSTVRGMTRLFLHAHHLGLDHPMWDERLEIDSPLPGDLADRL
ncbi:MAG: RluA family pseudouridine synthase [Acidimicrobiia bacterium]|nr:RluA family pseudouridine synthase [Acidimicrobiia bacterium]